MKWRPTNFKESMYPILMLNWLVGFGLIDYPVGNSRHKLFGIFILLTVALLCLGTYYYESLPCFYAQKFGLAIKLYRFLRLANTFGSSCTFIGWCYRKVLKLKFSHFENQNFYYENKILMRIKKMKSTDILCES